MINYKDMFAREMCDAPTPTEEEYRDILLASNAISSGGCWICRLTANGNSIGDKIHHTMKDFKSLDINMTQGARVADITLKQEKQIMKTPAEYRAMLEEAQSDIDISKHLKAIDVALNHAVSNRMRTIVYNLADTPQRDALKEDLERMGFTVKYKLALFSLNSSVIGLIISF